MTGRGKQKRAAARITQLAAELRHHNIRYYLHDDPEIPDAEYDQLIRELRELEEAWPALVAPDSPTQHVGTPPREEGFQPFEHRIPMLSLDNAMDAQEFEAFDAKVRRILASEDPVEYVGELKLDGAAVELVYVGRRLEVGATRGDGRIG